MVVVPIRLMEVAEEKLPDRDGLMMDVVIKSATQVMQERPKRPYLLVLAEYLVSVGSTVDVRVFNFHHAPYITGEFPRECRV
jgi:hypothetical protein